MYVTIGYEEAHGEKEKNIILKIEEDESKSIMEGKSYKNNQVLDTVGTIFFVKNIIEDKNNFISEYAVLSKIGVKSFDRKYKILSNNQIKELSFINNNIPKDNEDSDIVAAMAIFNNNKKYVFYSVDKKDTDKFIDIIELIKEEKNSYK